MTNKEFDAAVKLFEKASETAQQLSSYQLWAEEAAAVAEQLHELAVRMKKR